VEDWDLATRDDIHSLAGDEMPALVGAIER
jgi:hypothetical protein